MIVVAVLLFVLTWGVATALVGLVSMGAAPLWFLVGAPLLLASFVASAAFWAGGAETATDGPCSRIGRRLQSVTRWALDSTAFTLPLVVTGLLFVLALPLPGTTKNIAIGPVLMCAAVGGCALARWTRLPGESAR